MRPLRLLLSLATSFLTIIFLLYLVFSTPTEEVQNGTTSVEDNTGFQSWFSFTSPGSLFPPSAIISLTDDNTTFFLARPAAFGPALPKDSLSGPLWIGSGFGDDAMIKGGEMGCSDIPGWDGNEDMVSTASRDQQQTKAMSEHHENLLTKQPHGVVHVAERSIANDDGTDDHLRPRLPLSQTPKYRVGKSPEHADIQSIQQSAEIAGKIVLLKRGGCGFLEKVNWVQKRGGVALIVGDDQRGGALVRMYARGDTSNVTIPALFTSHTTAHLLSSLLPSGEFSAASGKPATKSIFAKSTQPKTKPQRKGEVPALEFQQASQSDYSAQDHPNSPRKASWYEWVLSGFGFMTSSGATRRPPISGKLNWTPPADRVAGQVQTKSETVKTKPSPTSGDFVIGEQDWRDSALLSSLTPSKTNAMQRPTPGSGIKGSSITPSSGQYPDDHSDKTKGWFNQFLDGKEPSSHTDVKASSTTSSTAKHSATDKPNDTHEGLWVTLSPTSMSTSPFFDTLLVLVVSPLVTLTVVYALLLLRSRIRRRRWRAPKSLVERLPVRTYHTISDSSPSATPNASSPTTPLLQHDPPRSTPSPSPLRSRAASDVPATSSAVQQDQRRSEEEKRESGLAAWRRKYGGRQKECVVCLEEYVDGVSQVMSLPCGHEFHADCITPWLVTRRRTCPICKGDVVRSLSQSYHDRAISRTESGELFIDEADPQSQAAHTRNDSPSASRPVPISPNPNADVEANWDDEGEGREIPRTAEPSSSFRDVSSSAVTAIYRGFEAVGRATGLQRRGSREDVDRDR